MKSLLRELVLAMILEPALEMILEMVQARLLHYNRCQKSRKHP